MTDGGAPRRDEGPDSSAPAPPDGAGAAGREPVTAAVQRLVDEGAVLAYRCLPREQPMVDLLGGIVVVLGRDSPEPPQLPELAAAFEGTLEFERSRWTAAEVADALEHLRSPDWHAGTVKAWSFCYETPDDVVGLRADVGPDVEAALRGRFGALVRVRRVPGAAFTRR